MSPRPLGRPRPAFITCTKGAEPLLADELRKLGVEEVEPAYLGVYATLSEEQLWRVNTYSRLANRVLIPLAEFEAPGRGELYEGAKRVRWDWWVHTSQTISVDASSVASGLTHTHFVAQVVKDGVVDQLRERFEERPSVDTQDPDLPINARLHSDLCTLSLDTSGDRLHKRGYRVSGGEAPLKETLASLLNHLAGWRPHEPLIDLTCGSGTLIIEAALRGARRPPNLMRAEASLHATRFGKVPPTDAQRAGQAPEEPTGPRPFAFSRWRSHSESRFQAWLERAPRPEPLEVHLWGSDLDDRQVKRSRENAERAGVSELCVWRHGDFKDLAPKASEWARGVVEASARPVTEGERLGLILMNPPYGERLGGGDELVRFYRDLGASLKAHFKGFEAWLIVEEGSPWKEIGLKPTSRQPIKNGALSCLFVQFTLY